MDDIRTETVGEVTLHDRFLCETRLYITHAELLARFILWLATWGSGIYYYQRTRQILAIPNYILMAGAYLVDMLFNKMSRERSDVYLKSSKVFNILMFAIAFTQLFMAGLQFIDYLIDKTIRGEFYYFLLFVFSSILVFKPLIDFVLLEFFSNSYTVSYKTRNSKKADKTTAASDKPEQTPGYKEELENAAKTGQLTEKEEDKPNEKDSVN